MRLRFLGTGTSSGVPVIACACPVCTSADERDRRLRTGAALEFTDSRGQPRTILIDATPDLRTQALKAGLTRCDAVVFTHNHVDHTFGLDEVRRFNVVQKGPVEVYAEGHTLEHLRRVYRHIFEAPSNVNPSFVATLIEHEIAPPPFAALDLWGARLTPIRLLHGRLPVLGFRIEAPPTAPPDNPFPLAYCTDVSAIPPESWRDLRGVKTLVLDALRQRKHPTHFSLDEAVGVAEQIGAQQTWFVHMSHELGHADTDARLPKGINLAYDGLILG